MTHEIKDQEVVSEKNPCLGGRSDPQAPGPPPHTRISLPLVSSQGHRLCWAPGPSGLTGAQILIQAAGRLDKQSCLSTRQTGVSCHLAGRGATREPDPAPSPRRGCLPAAPPAPSPAWNPGCLTVTCVPDSDTSARRYRSAPHGRYTAQGPWSLQISPKGGTRLCEANGERR